MLLSSTPLLTRLYSPDDYGQFGLILSIAGMIQILGTLRLDLAIKRAKTLEVAKSTFFISASFVGFTCVITVLTFLTLAFWHYEYLTLHLGNYFFLCPLIIFFLGFWQLTTAFFTREGFFKEKGITEVSQSISAVIINLVGGFLGWGNLVLGSTLSRLLSTLYSLKKLRRSLFPASFSKYFKSGQIKSVIQKNRDLMIFSIPSSFLYKLNSNLPIFYFANQLDSALVGFFVLTNRIVLSPVSLLGTSIGDVFQNRIRRKIGSYQEVLITILKVWFVAFAFIIPVSLFLFYFGPSIFGFFFGQNWEQSGYIASALAVSLTFKFTSAITNGTFTMLNLEQVGFYLSAIELPSKLLIFYYFDQNNQIMLSFWGIAIYDSLQIILANVFLLIFLMRKKSNDFKDS